MPVKVGINMGVYNLLGIKIRCSNCSNEYLGRLQFKVGEVWQHEYKVGDVIKIRPDDDKELRGSEIVAYGVLEDTVCPFCNFSNKEEYDIVIKDLVIDGYSLMQSYSPYQAHQGGHYYLR